jgi:hypothetical protein
MKNNQNNNTPTPSETPAQSGQTVSDINHSKKYEVTLFWAQYNQAKVIIEAGSFAEAEEKANDLQADEVEDWNPVDGDLSVVSVDQMDGGKSHD